MRKHTYFHQTSIYFIKLFFFSMATWQECGQMSLLWALGIHNKTNYKLGIHVVSRTAWCIGETLQDFNTYQPCTCFSAHHSLYICELHPDTTENLQHWCSALRFKLHNEFSRFNSSLVQSCWWLDDQMLCLILTCHWDKTLTSHLQRCSDETGKITSNRLP